MRDLPSGWRKEAIGNVIESAVDGPFGSNLKTEHYVKSPGVRVVRLQNIGAGYFHDSDRAYISEAHARSLTRHEVKPGDLLVASLGDENHPIARACVYPDAGRAIVKADCFRLRPKSEVVLSSYLARVLNNHSTRQGLEGYFQGITRDRVNLTSLLNFRVLMPPLVEQWRIAEVLDAIDSEIEYVQVLIDKHLRLRRAVLEAGLEEISESSPRHSLGELSVSGGDYGSNASSIPYKQGLPRYIRITDIDGMGRLRPDSIVGHARSGSGQYLLDDGDLLIARTGFTTGKCLLYLTGYGECVFAGYLVRFRFDRSKVLPSYVFLWTHGNEFTRWVGRTIREVGQRNISAREYASHPLLVPSIEAQWKLVERVAGVDHLSDGYRRRLGQLHLLKQGLMEDLLTGRVRVPV
jgi:type I restriction enzyme, S subunit